MSNRVVEVRSFGGPEQLAIVEAPLPKPRHGEVRIRMLASSLEYTDVVIRRHLYLQTMTRKPPFVMGYDVVGEVDEVGEGVTDFQVGDRVADLTVLGSNAEYRTLRADHLVRVPRGVDPAEAAAVILSWTTAYQMLHRTAHVKQGQRVLVQGAAGAVGQALLVLGKMAGLEVWGTGRAEHAGVIRELGATPIDYQHDDYSHAVPGGFDIVFDGVGEDGYRKSYAALSPRGLLVAFGYTARVGEQSHLKGLLGWMLQVYGWRQLVGFFGGQRTKVYSINLMRALHPAWFKQDLEKLFLLLASRAIAPRVAQRISFDQVPEGHRRVEAGGLDGKVVLCADA